MAGTQSELLHTGLVRKSNMILLRNSCCTLQSAPHDPSLVTSGNICSPSKGYYPSNFVPFRKIAAPTIFLHSFLSTSLESHRNFYTLRA
ncbi:hypothetical protein BDZ91DRAFT_724333 [Kalaharituber pfeilii]|nr:hypothetical protein BDZ91DRAFT_724333 [Kalaharituber pfeilii]